MTVAVGQLLAGKYRVERELGRGGMGAVYLAENTAIGRKVALKVLLPDAAEDEGMVERFRQEARAAAAIGHPGIVDVLDLGRSDDGDEFIVMEYLRGESLREWIARVEVLSVRDAVETVLPLVEALGAAHARGIVHRDLKPDNIFIAHEPAHVVKILDFGISKLMTRSADEALTATGAVMGTPHYMAPEQARGLRELGPPADVYALGAIIYRVLVGEPLFSGGYTEVLLKLINDQPPPLTDARPDAPPALSQLVAQMVAKAPPDRPSLAAIKTQLGAILAALPPRERRPITPKHAAPSANIGEDDTLATPPLDGDATLPPVSHGDAASAAPAHAADAAQRDGASEPTPGRPTRRLIAGGAIVGVAAAVAVLWLATKGAPLRSVAHADAAAPADARSDKARRPAARADARPAADAHDSRDAARPLLDTRPVPAKPTHHKTPRPQRRTPAKHGPGKKPLKTKQPSKIDKPFSPGPDEKNPFDKHNSP